MSFNLTDLYCKIIEWTGPVTVYVYFFFLLILSNEYNINSVLFWILKMTHIYIYIHIHTQTMTLFNGFTFLTVEDIHYNIAIISPLWTSHITMPVYYPLSTPYITTVSAYYHD